ncbi:MAG: hypothetical protein J6Y95_05995, partial [Lachnospiraceae bacterium]|nr:hypothetical protein [Lachnospiraceae bacterium]
NALGLCEKMRISWYLTKPGDPEQYPVPEYQDSVQTFVYEYGGQRFPVWSYLINEQGKPVLNSFVLYLFE